LPLRGKVVSENFPGPMRKGEAETIKRSSKKRYISIRWWIQVVDASLIFLKKGI